MCNEPTCSYLRLSVFLMLLFIRTLFSELNWLIDDCCKALLVADAPKISCYSSEASIGDKNVRLSCVIRAKPRLSALFWIIDGNGTALAEGEVISGHWTLVMVSILTISIFMSSVSLERCSLANAMQCSVGISDWYTGITKRLHGGVNNRREWPIGYTGTEQCVCCSALSQR